MRRLVIGDIRPRIQIIENEGNTALAFYDLLTAERAIVEIVGATQSINRAATHPPHLAFFDHNLGGKLRGNTLARRFIEAGHPTIRVSFSGAGPETEGEQIDQRLFDAVFQKGMDPALLVEEIRHLLETHAQRVGLPVLTGQQ